MKKIRLKGGNAALIDDGDLNLVRGVIWKNSRGYAISEETGEPMHRIIISPAKNKEVDHINRDRLDNRRCNLRECTRLENSKNLPRCTRNTSGYKGVSYHKVSGLWKAYINCDNVTYSLKYHKTKALAAAAYDKASRDLHGDFGSPNDEQLNVVDFSTPDTTDIYDYVKIQRDFMYETTPLSLIEGEEHANQLNAAMAKLDYRSREIIRLRFNPEDAKKYTLKEIGAIFGVSKERTRQIQNNALRRLKHLISV